MKIAGRNMSRNYRVVKVTFETEKVSFYLQRECKFLRKFIFFGPKVWKTFYSEDGWVKSEGWTFFRRWGTEFPSAILVKEEIDQQKWLELRRKVKSIKIIKDDEFSRAI